MKPVPTHQDLVFQSSPFVANICERFPDLIHELSTSGDLYRNYDGKDYDEMLIQQLNTLSDEDSLIKQLRLFRRREILRIIWRDLSGISKLETMIQELSWLADACIKQSLEKLYKWQCSEMGTPMDEHGNTQYLSVIALGKLGGNELNLSSDIDLMFCYPARGDTVGVKSVSNEVFFRILGQKLIQALNKVTADGYVFRVDMRLRPLGSSGPLVMPLSAMDHYYQTQGRPWERYALVKARVITGDTEQRTSLKKMIRGFVYHQDLDFTVKDALREMHATIVKEATSEKMDSNIKLGWGGIRDIEFTVQAFQLIHGGEDRRLQSRHLLPTLKTLVECELMPQADAESLKHAYIFLRNVEHRLQAVSDLQTHDLPSDEKEQMRLACSMQYESWESFSVELNNHRKRVHEIFQQLMAEPDSEAGLSDVPHSSQEMTALWLGHYETMDAEKILNEMGFELYEATLALLNQFQTSDTVQALSDTGIRRLNRLMPFLLMRAGKADQSYETLRRVLQVIEKIIQRTTSYLVLLHEDPTAMRQLTTLCSISPWIADQLSRYPILLGQLLGSKQLSAPLDLSTIEGNLTRRVEAIDSHERDEQMQALRRFKLIHVFRVATLDVTGVLPLMRVSDHLTNIACVLLRYVQSLAFTQTVEELGAPEGVKDAYDQFAIVAYGKLGGIELGYGSDLDLVFLHTEHQQFYLRMAQHILRWLNVQTSRGLLYEVDTRLRPSGESGLLVCSFTHFEEYQLTKAWVWEHQALVRARVVSGASHLSDLFNRIRAKTLSKERDENLLRETVADMRQRMRDALTSIKQGQFDLKHGQGGIADIEFIVQYYALRYANKFPAVCEYTDNIRILEALGKEALLPSKTVRFLTDTYRNYRAMVHRLDLQSQPSWVPDDQLVSEREGVFAIWEELMGAPATSTIVGSERG